MASVGAGATRIRKTFRTEAEALAWEAQEAAAKAATRAVPTPPPRPVVWTLQEAFDQTHRHTWRGTPGERKAVLNASQAMAFFGPDTPTSAITADWVVEWMEELQDKDENGGATCNKKLSALSMMLKRAQDYGGLPALPRMKRYKEALHRVRWFTDEEEQAMLKAALGLGLQDLHNLIVVGLDTGFRRAELLRLGRLDYSQGNLMAHAGETKNGGARAVPCTTRVKEIVVASEGRLFPSLTSSTLRKQWETLRHILGKDDDPGFIPHVMRHTCATRLVAAGTPLNEVQAWMGHKVIQTTMRYAHLMPGALNGAVARLERRTQA
jgi:integrase